MSHVATVELEVRDLGALRAACAEVGLEFREGQTTHRWFGKWVKDYHGSDAAYLNGIDPKSYGKCDHALAVKGNANAYEVGVVKMPGGAHKLVWDFYGGGYGLMAAIGKSGKNLIQAYAGQVARKSLALRGFVPAGKKVKADGTVELVFERRS